jgi:hypothetical protein
VLLSPYFSSQSGRYAPTTSKYFDLAMGEQLFSSAGGEDTQSRRLQPVSKEKINNPKYEEYLNATNNPS